MTAPPLAAAAAWELVPAGAGARQWREALPDAEAGALASRERREALRQRLGEVLDDDRLATLAQSFEPWWPVRPRRSQGLELVVVHPDGRRDKAVLHHRVVRVGRDPSCQLQLQAETVSSHHCEIRFDDDKLWLVDLASSNGTRLNGFELTPFEPRPLVSGDQIQLRPFRLVVGTPDVQYAPPRMEARLVDALQVRGSDPFPRLSGAHGLWCRVRAGAWEGYLHLPHGWLAYAYTRLGYEAPTPAPFGNPVDLSLTAFLLRHVAAEIGQRSGLQVSLSGLVTADRVATLAGPAADSWDGARVDLLLGDHQYELTALWPATASAARELREPPGWLLDAPYAVSVVGGMLRLSGADLAQVDPGDIVLPDRWLPDHWVDQTDAELGPVALLLQSWSRPARLRFETGYYHLEVGSSGWRIAPKGGLVTADGTPTEPQETPLDEEEPVRLPDELTALVTFELERLAVPLKELLEWQEGMTLRLQRSPEDPVRIVLRQPGEERLLGYGRVVVVEDRIGIQIERWLAERQG
ncbi:MAG TPA: FHA domain-containing protein [Thermoanaerobaculia bacterium]|nr:FHA domain-containing protein [Thermoanaerobaculia bacterium]